MFSLIIIIVLTIPSLKNNNAVRFVMLRWLLKESLNHSKNNASVTYIITDFYLYNFGRNIGKVTTSTVENWE